MPINAFFRLFLIGLVSSLILLSSISMGEARIGSGTSSGSRGSFTYSPPPSTPTAPYSIQPMQRSLTPQMPSPNYVPAYPQPAYANRGFFGGAGGFGTGLFGGLLGAGLFGLIFGHGLMGGIGGGMSFLGLLLQVALLYFGVKWALGFFARQSTPEMAGAPVTGGVAAASSRPSRPSVATVSITEQDYGAFEKRLYTAQEAYSREDLETLRRIATPEMVMFFADDLARNAGQNLVNRIANVKLLQGDLAEAWREGSTEYATVAMRFSLVDWMVDRVAGRTVSGDPVHPQEVIEVWTFRRDQGGAWMISAIQQTH
jgi:predicted lipid-binding transport protein (Tim44 family)